MRPAAAGFGQNLKSVANPQDVAAAGGMVVNGAHDRGTRRHRPAAQVIAKAEAAGNHHQVEVAQIGVLMPDHPRLLAEAIAAKRSPCRVRRLMPGKMTMPAFIGRYARRGRAPR